MKTDHVANVPENTHPEMVPIRTHELSDAIHGTGQSGSVGHESRKDHVRRERDEVSKFPVEFQSFEQNEVLYYPYTKQAQHHLPPRHAKVFPAVADPRSVIFGEPEHKTIEVIFSRRHAVDWDQIVDSVVT